MRTVFVTGAGSGIGKASAQCLGADPDTAVVCIDLDEASAIATAESIPKGLGLKADVSDEQQCLKAVQKGVEAFGNPAGLVHCAAIFGWQDVNTLTQADLEKNFSINVQGSFFMARATANAIIESGGHGGIVLLSSGASRIALGAPVYSATKGAVESLVREFAVYWANSNVRVNAILPGLVTTPMSHVAQTDKQLNAAVMNHIPMKRFAEPEEIAHACAFLVSDKASYITGACLPVDGGFLVV